VSLLLFGLLNSFDRLELKPFSKVAQVENAEISKKIWGFDDTGLSRSCRRFNQPSLRA
jgi:hypothetical protein